MSIFHRMKKAVVGKKEEAGSASLCPEYDAIRVEFESLHDVMIRIRQHLLTYREANSRMWTSATSLSAEFGNMLEAPAGDDHPYTAMAATMRASHAQLPAEREKLDTMLNACLFPLKEQLAKYEELKVRMADHDKQKDEVVYYQGKVSSLRSAREQSKKAESAADKEKYERNVKKMMDQEAAFHATDAQLTAELRYAFEHRVAVLGPIMLAFVCAEREIASRYTQAINEVKLVDVNEANAWLARHEAAMAAKSSQPFTAPTVAVATTDRTVATSATAPVVMVPDLMSGAALSDTSSSGVVVSPPQYVATNGTTATGVDTTTQFQSPRGANSFDNFQPSFSNTAFSDPFYAASSSAPTANLYQPETDGVPYTIGSTTTHTAPSVTSTTTESTVNGAASSLPVESSTSATSTTSDIAPAAPAVMMDDMALQKTHGADQLDAPHAGVGAVLGDVEKSEKSDVDDAATYAGSGVGEKTDMFAPTTESSAIV